ncbi:hypothetical protein C8R45DRAFT_1108642 [Mycena sanguinolenta]|nr:hypothetical protein C8R45DRAFT_1108642 [Mycena sanguinolenta]
MTLRDSTWRLIPTTAYESANASATVEAVYKQLLDAGTLGILGNLVAGGQVSANVDIVSAVNPAWRTAKVHSSQLILANEWLDSASLSEIDSIRHSFQTTAIPILEQLSGPNAGSYSNEADLFQLDFQTTFYGPNYAKLSAIKGVDEALKTRHRAEVKALTKMTLVGQKSLWL